jgi:hypothetical protein
VIISTLLGEEAGTNARIEIDRPAVEPRRRARLQATHLKSEPPNRLSEFTRKRLAVTSRGPLLSPDVN